LKPAAVDAFIALGSNLGDRRRALDEALCALRQRGDVAVIQVSDIIETPPIGRVDQPHYLNAAARLQTQLPPAELLQVLLSIEEDHGRIRVDGSRWGPRTLDLDLLLFDDQVVNQPGLCIPHPEMHRRSFVLIPLAQIAPHQIHPILGKSVAALLCTLKSETSMECPTHQAGL